MTCEYTVSVTVTLAWPSRSLTVLTGPPADSSRLACVPQVVDRDHRRRIVAQLPAAPRNGVLERAPEPPRVQVGTFQVREDQGARPDE